MTSGSALVFTKFKAKSLGYAIVAEAPNGAILLD